MGLAGLIAEEVAEVFPELTIFNAEGKPETVKYHLLAPLLLNEYLKEHKKNEAQHEEFVKEHEKVEALEARLKALEKLMEKTAANSGDGRR